MEYSLSWSLNRLRTQPANWMQREDIGYDRPCDGHVGGCVIAPWHHLGAAIVGAAGRGAAPRVMRPVLIGKGVGVQAAFPEHLGIVAEAHLLNDLGTGLYLLRAVGQGVTYGRKIVVD